MLTRPDAGALSCLFLGLFILLFGLWSRIIKEHLYLSEPLLSTLLGVFLSTKVIGLLSFIPEDWDQGLSQDTAREKLAWFCRIVIGIQVLFAASTLPNRWMLQRPNVKSMAIMLLPVMATAWLVSSLFVKICIPQTMWIEALMIGACVAPTDPVLANSVVKGIYAERHIPVHVRELLVAESGLNDGFGTPFLFLPIFAFLNSFRLLGTIRAFVLQTVLYDVIFGSSLGVGIGYLARKWLETARRRETIDRESMLVFSCALALFTIGLGEVLGTNGLLGCFFAGTALNWTDQIRAEDMHSRFSEGVEMFFDSAVFLVFGTILPFSTWIDPDFLPLPNLIFLGVMILIFRRIPAVMALYTVTPSIKTTKEAFFTGYFGPIGVSALYYALMATETLPRDFERRNTIIAVTTFLIFCSILVHGASAPLIMLVSNITSVGNNHPVIQDAPTETDALLGGIRSFSWWRPLFGRPRERVDMSMEPEDIHGTLTGRNVKDTSGSERQAYR